MQPLRRPENTHGYDRRANKLLHLNGYPFRDNSEGWFKTLKFTPVFPESFNSVGEARAFMADFVENYNHAQAYRHRTQHPSRRPLRPRGWQSHRTVSGAGRGPRPQPGAIQHDSGPQNPHPARHRLDRQTSRTRRSPNRDETSRLNSRWPHSP